MEILATKNVDGFLVLMIVDHAAHAPTDNNGVGDPRTVIVDVSALGTFSSGTSIIIDKNANATSGPAGKYHSRTKDIGDAGRLRGDVSKVEDLV